jgi:SAM-dependent methyltransferase
VTDPAPTPALASGRPTRLDPYAAGAIVFVCSAAVLMLEILAGRILAPYVGISLETYTAIIGTVLAGIAVGAWSGGYAADRPMPSTPRSRRMRRSTRSTWAAAGSPSLATLAATRPGTQNTVLEIDPAVRDLAEDELGLRTSPALRVRIGDARLGIRKQADNSRDLVVGDAFGSLSVPWHLTTREFVQEIDRVLRPDGVYVQNVIDYPSFQFVKSQLATLREQFHHVAAISHATFDSPGSGGNVILVATNGKIDRDLLEQRVAAHGDTLHDGAALDRFIGSAPVITDDFAPIDQWLREDSAH